MRAFLSRALIVAAALSLLGAGSFPALAAAACTGAHCVFLPTVSRGCAAVGGAYQQGLAIQYDRDNPPRPTATWIGKNLRYRSYTEVTGQTGFTPSLIDYGPSSVDPNNTPPQFRTLFSPARNPTGLRFFRTYNWNDAPSPNPGTRGSVMTDPLISVLGIGATAGETVRTPVWSGAINAGVVAMVMYADPTTVTIAYHREDSAGDVGYTVYIDGLCTDPNLVALYNSLDANPNRYTLNAFRSETYNLPYLTSNQPIGTALGTTIMVAIVDSGPLMDPRSCRGWWIDLVGTSACPLRNGSTIN